MARRRHEYTRRSEAEIRALLKAYSKLKWGIRARWLDKRDLTTSHISVWKRWIKKRTMHKSGVHRGLAARATIESRREEPIPEHGTSTWTKGKLAAIGRGKAWRARWREDRKMREAARKERNKQKAAKKSATPVKEDYLF